MHVNVKDVQGGQVSPGVVERVLLDSVKSDLGSLEVKHFIISTGGSVMFGLPLTEYQHYVIQGCAAKGSRNGGLLHQDSAWFVPCNAPWGGEPARKHSLHHVGEGDVHILTVSYTTPRPAYRWAKSRSRNLHEIRHRHSSSSLVGYVQIFSEEEHANMGAQRMHAIDIQTNPKGGIHMDHRNPEEIIYVLRGRGEANSDGESFRVGPGSMIYTSEGAVHGIQKIDETIQYIVVEFVDQTKMWRERGES